MTTPPAKKDSQPPRGMGNNKATSKPALEKWKDAENRITASSEIHRCFEGDLRKCRFEVFPYALIFRIRGDELQVLAVMHMSRRPGYWKARGENLR